MSNLASFARVEAVLLLGALLGAVLVKLLLGDVRTRGLLSATRAGAGTVAKVQGLIVTFVTAGTYLLGSASGAGASGASSLDASGIVLANGQPACEATDQRGEPRADGACDIGAFEAEAD